MSLSTPNGYVIASNAPVPAGRSWFSEQMALPDAQAGISYEIKLTGNGTGSFTPRGGNARRHQRVGEVVATPTAKALVGGERLPSLGIEATDLPDVSLAPLETLLNIGNVNCNFAELQFTCLTGVFYLSVIATGKAA